MKKVFTRKKGYQHIFAVRNKVVWRQFSLLQETFLQYNENKIKMYYLRLRKHQYTVNRGELIR
jgi:hypothetical protein